MRQGEGEGLLVPTARLSATDGSLPTDRFVACESHCMVTI